MWFDTPFRFAWGLRGLVRLESRTVWGWVCGGTPPTIVRTEEVRTTHHFVIANEVTAKHPVKEAISEAEG